MIQSETDRLHADQPGCGRFVDGEHRLPVRVYFEDTDAGGMVYHATYLRYMERARSEMLRAAGIAQRASLEAGEGGYVVAELAIRYLKPARLDDALLLVSRIERVRSASIGIQQRVMRDGDTAAEAEVTVAFVAPSGRPRRQPAPWIETFRRLQGDVPAQ